MIAEKDAKDSERRKEANKKKKEKLKVVLCTRINVVIWIFVTNALIWVAIESPAFFYDLNI